MCIIHYLYLFSDLLQQLSASHNNIFRHKLSLPCFLAEAIWSSSLKLHRHLLSRHLLPISNWNIIGHLEIMRKPNQFQILRRTYILYIFSRLCDDIKNTADDVLCWSIYLINWIIRLKTVENHIYSLCFVYGQILLQLTGFGILANMVFCSS